MKAALCETLDGPDGVVVRDVDDPGEPGDGQIRVAVGACGVSFADLLMTRGGYQVKPPLPFPVGGESAGRITALGRGVSGFDEGDAVLVSTGCVEHAVVDAARATRIPDGVDIEAAASFRSNYTTALYGLERGRLRAGETLLVHGAGGGVGLAAVDVGKLMGATVIATASSDAKLAVARELGADHLIDYREGFRDAVKDLTGQRGADVIYDPVGGDVFDESMRCVAPFGRILIVGFTGGRPALAKTNHLLIKDAEAIGFTIGALGQRDPARAERIHRTLMTWLGAKRITPYISHRLPIERAADALRLIVNREVIGKVVVVP